MIETLVNIYIALYPIAPGYFKIFGFDSGVVLSFLFCIIYIFFKGKSHLRIKKSHLSIVGVFLLLMLLPLIFHGEITRLVRVIFEYGITLLILMDYFDSERKIDKAINILIIVATIMCFFGIYESLFGKNFFTFLFNGSELDLTPDLQMRGAFARSETTFGHAIPYAIYLSIVGLLTSYNCFVNKDRRYLFSYILIVLNIVLSISRAPIIVFFISQVLLLYLAGLKTFVRTIGRIMVAIILLTLFVSWMSPSFLNSITSMVTMVLAVFSENAAQQIGYITNANPFTYRIELIKVLPQYFEGHIIFGHGDSERITFNMLGHSYYSVDNSYLAWTLKYGIIGLIGNVIPIVKTIKSSIKYRDKNPVFIAFISIGVCYMLNLFAVAQLGEYKIWIIVLSLVFSYMNLYRTKKLCDGV